MKDYLACLRDYFVELMVFALGCVIFAVTFALYGFPLEAVLYPVLLCGVLLFFYILWKVGRIREKKRFLQRLVSLPGELWKEELSKIDWDRENQLTVMYGQLIEKLLEINQEIEEKNRERYGDMVEYYTMWAHQIKTPIAAMRLVLQNQDSPLARRLSAEVFHTEQYVEMVLVFLRLQGDSTDYVIREYPLDPIVKSAVKNFAGEFIDRKLKLNYQPSGERVLTDEKWLSFVIEQVLSNSLKYTAQGSISIYMEPDQTLCIRDTGMGIAPEDLPRIFERGYTGENGRQDKKASGIGLFLCQQICRNLNHTISAESVIGQGSVFRIGLRHVPIEIE